MELESKIAENAGEKTMSQANKGGLKTMPFILATESCENFASTGFSANMITYLTTKLNLPLVRASNTLTNFGGTANFTPLIGALIADSWAGRFWTLFVGIIIFQLGLVIITLSATIPKLHPKSCPTQENCQEASGLMLGVLYISLLLKSLGSGCIRPCAVTFAGDQFDMSKAKRDSGKWNLFNWYYFFLTIPQLLALTVIVYIQDNVSWIWGLAIPSIVMVVSTISFVAGLPLYRKVKPGGSALTRLAQVSFAAFKKRNIVTPDEGGELYENEKLDAKISTTGRLVHSNQFRWLDRAAVKTEGDVDEKMQPKLWRLATVQRVEELKCIIRVLPIWGAGILFATSRSHIGSFTIIQARSMDRHLSHSFQIPPASLSIFTVLTVLVGLPFYERTFVPLARRFTGNPKGITCLQRIGFGFAINILAALAEIKRKAVAADHGLQDKPTVEIPISIFWLVPQYCLHGIAEVFSSVGHIEFLYDQFPESLRSSAIALSALTSSLGDYLGTMVVSLVHKYTGKERNWLPNRNLNTGKLDYYYWLVTGIQVINFIYYVICAKYYTYKPLEKIVESDEGIDLEREKNVNVE